MYFKIICSSDGTKLVVFRERVALLCKCFSTDNFQPICEVQMFEERIKRGVLIKALLYEM